MVWPWMIVDKQRGMATIGGDERGPKTVLFHNFAGIILAERIQFQLDELRPANSYLLRIVHRVIRFFSFRIPFRENFVMFRRSRVGFTLVELLVVITVIAMLMALLIPAAMAVVERANQAKCLNHLSEMGIASATFESVKSYYPPECSNMQINTTKVPWPALLVNNLGRGDIDGLSKTTGSGWSTFMEVYTCPSFPISSLSPTSTPLHYAANVGRKNGTGSPSTPADWKENGVFMPQIKGELFEKVSSSYVNSHDGLKFTLLIMESICNAEWGVPYIDDKNYGVYWTGNNAAADPRAINDPTILAAPRSKDRCYITSKHPGGVNVVFCGGNAQWLNDSISADVIDLLMTPFGKNARSSSTVGSATQPNPFNEGMLQ